MKRRTSYLTKPLKRTREFRYLEALLNLHTANIVALSARIAFLEGKPYKR